VSMNAFGTFHFFNAHRPVEDDRQRWRVRILGE
jgi:hypothetical protein